MIDHAALYRCVGSAEAMAGADGPPRGSRGRSRMSLVQVLPAVAHPATQSGFMVADGAALRRARRSAASSITEPETVTALQRLFDTLRAECYRASESAAIIRKAGALWTGERAATAEPTAVSA